MLRAMSHGCDKSLPPHDKPRSVALLSSIDVTIYIARRSEPRVNIRGGPARESDGDRMDGAE
jgi:hypothetical protein